MPMPDYLQAIIWVAMVVAVVWLFGRAARAYGWRKVLWGYFKAMFTFVVPLVAAAYTLKLIWMQIPEWSRFILFIILWAFYGVVCIYICELVETKQKRCHA